MPIERFINELEVLIRARYSIIYVNTLEEERAMDYISGISEKLNKRVITWTCTRGLELNGQMLDPKTTDFLEALATVERLAEVPSLLVWMDLHSFLSGSPVYIRRYKEFAQKIRAGSPSNSIIIGPLMEIPIELQKEVAILDMPFPDLNEMSRIIVQFTDPYKHRPDLSIDQSENTIHALARASLGLSKSEVENCLAKSLVKYKRISIDDIDFILEEKKQNIRKAGILEYTSTEDMNVSDIGGLDNLKKWLDIRKAAYTAEARKFGILWPKGVLLVGIPGCGKSLSAKCVAAAWKMPLLRLDIGRVFSGIVGSSEANIRLALSMCEAVSPSILWIDEIEKALSGVGSSNFSDGGTAARVFGTILTWMQEKKSAVFVFATANNMSSLPSELLRKGRFDEIFFVDLPNEQERAEIFRIHLQRIRRNPEQFDINELVRVSGESHWGDGVRLTGSEIEACVNQALLEAFFLHYSEGMTGRDIVTEDIGKAIRRIVPLSKIRKDDIGHMRAWAADNAVRASVSAEQLTNQVKEITVGRSIDF